MMKIAYTKWITSITQSVCKYRIFTHCSFLTCPCYPLLPCTTEKGKKHFPIPLASKFIVVVKNSLGF